MLYLYLLTLLASLAFALSARIVSLSFSFGRLKRGCGEGGELRCPPYHITEHSVVFVSGGVVSPGHVFGARVQITQVITGIPVITLLFGVRFAFTYFLK